MPILLDAHHHFLPRKLARLVLDKDVMLLAIKKNRLRRHADIANAITGKIDVNEHLGFKQALAVIHGAANLDRAGGGINELRNHIHLARKSQPFKSPRGEREK